MALSIGSAGVSGGGAAASVAGACRRRPAASPSSKWRSLAVCCIGWVSRPGHSWFLPSLDTRRTPFTSFTGGPICVQDPEGILGPPQGGHIGRLEFKRRLERDADAREAFNRQIHEQKERRRALRQSRTVPDTITGLVEYFLDTEARELEFEIARLRPRLNREFFDHLQLELAQLRFAVNRTKEMEDRLIELEAMQKVLLDGTEAYDKMQEDLVVAKERLTKILQSKDKKATLLDMVEHNELTRSVLALLDENIASAIQNDQKEAAAFMENVRATMLKYITV